MKCFFPVYIHRFVKLPKTLQGLCTPDHHTYMQTFPQTVAIPKSRSVVTIPVSGDLPAWKLKVDHNHVHLSIKPLPSEVLGQQKEMYYIHKIVRNEDIQEQG